MIIGLLNQKGGVGKTTMTLNLAAFYASGGARVLVVDADPQGSALAWSSIREADPLFPVIGMAKTTLHKDLPALARDYDITLIDGAPRVTGLGRSAIMASDLVVIPVQPSPFDVWATDEIVRLIEEAQIYNDKLSAVFAVNRKIVNTAIGRDVAKAFAEAPFPVLPTALCQRVLYAESAGEGRTVIEVAPDGEAAREVGLLAQALVKKQERKAA